MKTCILIAACLLSGGLLAQNPYSIIGREAKMLTLTKGQYPEFHSNDSLQKVGSVIVNMRTKKIVKFLTQDELSHEAETSSRWWAIDPLFKSYPNMSPYSFAANSPILMYDADGQIVQIANWGTLTNTEKTLLTQSFQKLSGGIMTVNPTSGQVIINNVSAANEMMGIYNSGQPGVMSADQLAQVKLIQAVQDKDNTTNVTGSPVANNDPTNATIFTNDPNNPGDIIYDQVYVATLAQKIDAANPAPNSNDNLPQTGDNLVLGKVAVENEKNTFFRRGVTQLSQIFGARATPGEQAMVAPAEAPKSTISPPKTSDKKQEKINKRKAKEHNSEMDKVYHPKN